MKSKLNVLFVLGFVFGQGLALAAEAPRISALDWLTGTWRAAQGSEIMEETFTSPKGGMVLETNQIVKDGKTVFYEVGWLAEETGLWCSTRCPTAKSAFLLR
jgi:hypothetical protein